MITSNRALRTEFWRQRQNPTITRQPGYSQNQYPTDTRQSWCDFVEYMRRDGQISERLAQSATL